MVPYRDNGHLTERQKNYNYCHSSTRMALNRKSVWPFKGRFRSLLHHLPMNRTDLIASFILACCVMHNICILNGDDFDDLACNVEVHNVSEQVAANYVPVQTGAIKRDLICERLPLKNIFD